MKKLSTFIFIFCFFIPAFLQASYVENQPYQIQQPDGTVIDCFVSGDEYFNWLHDANGYTIVQAEDGYYYYGIQSGELVVPSVYKVNIVNPEAIQLRKWVKISKEEYQRRKEYYTVNQDNTASISAPHTGTMNNVSIYIKFSDDTEFTTTRQTYDDLFNLPAGNSLKSYFSEVSYTQFTISTTGYPACAMSTNYSYTDTHPRSYFQPYNASTNPNGYVDETDRRLREHALLRDAVNWVNANSPVPTNLDIDGDLDGNVDNVCFIVRGGNGAWASLLWAHRWVLYSENVYINGKRVWDYTFQPESQVNVKTLCHEMFHALGAPDLYHYNDGGLGIAPVGSWDLMQSGGGHMGAYMKWKYSQNTWITSIPEITTSGTYTLQPLTASTNNCYKIASPNSTNQFFIVEYRKQTGTFEGTIPGSGLLVYRIDNQYTGNANGPPDEVYIYRPNGTTTVNGSISSAHYSTETGRTSINDATNPSSFLQNGTAGGLNIYDVTSSSGSTISFKVGLSNVANPASLTALPSGTSQIDLSWVKNVAQNNVILAYSTSSVFGIPVMGSSYSVGSTIPGGGTVIYAGSATNFSHTALSPSTVYYYKLWSVDGTNAYSNGVVANATTGCTVGTLPLAEYFPGEIFPACWTQQQSGNGTIASWIAQPSSNAGGTACEMRSLYQQVNQGATRLVSPPFNTVGLTQLNLSFKHMLDDYGPGATLRIQSSTNGQNWTNESWMLATASNTNIGPATVNTTITSNLNSPSTYIAFTIEGNLYQYDYWYIDNVSVQAAAAQVYSITTSANPSSGGTVTGGGNYSIGQSVTVTATANQNWNFLDWTENGVPVSASPAYTFNASANRNLVANFSLNQVTVSTSALPLAGGTTSGGGTVAVNSQVTVVATPNTGYDFVSWTVNGNVVSTLASYTLTVNSSVQLIANFQIKQFNVTAVANPSSAGTVTGSGVYPYNAMVTLSAAPFNGWNFLGWFENGLLLSIDPTWQFNALANRSIEAQFALQIVVYNVIVSANPTQGGTVSGGTSAASGSLIAVHAVANPGWEFVHWTENGNVVSTDPNYSFTILANRNLVAEFIQTYSISANSNPAAGGTITGTGNYNSGSAVTLQAIANQGFVFYSWTENGNTISTLPTLNFTASGNRNLTANFLSTVEVGVADNKGILIYPNPTNGNIRIEMQNVGIAQVKVMDLSGRLVFQILPKDNNQNLLLDLSGLQSGVYYIEVTADNGLIKTEKVVLKK